jgi:hypothetical protein
VKGASPKLDEAAVTQAGSIEAARRLLDLWFGFTQPVDRPTYVLHGAGLMLGKFLVDAALVYGLTANVWTPLDYFHPAVTVRAQALQGAPEWLGPALIVLALPFLWIGVSMSLRRCLDAGLRPALALVFFVPVANYALMAALALAPSRAGARPPIVSAAARSALLGVAGVVGITLVTVLAGIYLRRVYSTGLFLGTPFTIGYVCSHLYNRAAPRPAGASIRVALAGVVVAAGAMIVIALEGVACVVMALPIAAFVAVPGALLGRAVARRWHGPATGVGLGVVLAPLAVLLEPRAEPAIRDVVSVIEVDAPPAAVWRHVVTFPEPPPPREWLFRVGVAAPVAARIEGAGVGATRYCDFTTGSFTEPVTAWEEGARLAFDITDQPSPLRETSPYRGLRVPHLDGYFRATSGEFRLSELPGGGTRLEGRTRYAIALFPESYWALFAGAIVDAIHLRVLAHVERLAEAEPR